MGRESVWNYGIRTCQKPSKRDYIEAARIMVFIPSVCVCAPFFSIFQHNAQYVPIERVYKGKFFVPQESRRGYVCTAAHSTNDEGNYEMARARLSLLTAMKAFLGIHHRLRQNGNTYTILFLYIWERGREREREVVTVVRFASPATLRVIKVTRAFHTRIFFPESCFQSGGSHFVLFRASIPFSWRLMRHAAITQSL